MSSSSAHKGLIINGRIGSGMNDNGPGNHPGGAGGMRPMQQQSDVVSRRRPEQDLRRHVSKTLGATTVASCVDQTEKAA